jgi:hypothetical protein
VDFLHDRQGCAGEDPAALQDILATELPVSVLTEKIGDLLASGKMHIRRAELFTIHTSDKLMVQANTNASAGYCYVAAWLRPEVNGE